MSVALLDDIGGIVSAILNGTGIVAGALLTRIGGISAPVLRGESRIAAIEKGAAAYVLVSGRTTFFGNMA